MTSEKPRRRWFQFSLRALFVLVTVVGIAMPAVMWGLQRWERERQLEAISEAIEEHDSKSGLR